jgi:CTP synthase (UTP-ammonia lyase)
VLGIGDAEFEETAPASPTLVITRLACSLAGVEQSVFIAPKTLAFKAYGKDRVTERFTCNYGLNERYRDDIIRKDLSIVGKDGDGNARIVELACHRFFIATLFLPQLSSKHGNPHPLIVAYLRATRAFIKEDVA